MPSDPTLTLSELPVPAAPEEITPKWLRKVLGATFTNNLPEAMEMQRIGQHYGLASEIYRCLWRGTDASRSVVIKVWDTSGPAGTGEAHFYNTFGAHVGTRVPTCYHAATDPFTQRGILVLEDLAGAVQGDCLQQLPLELARTVAQSLAGFHATWMEHERLQAEWLRPSGTWDLDEHWFMPRRALFLERFGDKLDDFARALLERLEHTPKVANARLEAADTTLLHGDLHLDNILFENGAAPTVLDWARCARGPLVLDLDALLFDMSQLEDTNQIIAAYLSAFAGHVGWAPDEGALRYQLGGALLWRFARSTCGVARWHPESPREAALIEVSIERAVRAVRHWWTQEPSLFSFL